MIYAEDVWIQSCAYCQADIRYAQDSMQYAYRETEERLVLCGFLDTLPEPGGLAGEAFRKLKQEEANKLRDVVAERRMWEETLEKNEGRLAWFLTFEQYFSVVQIVSAPGITIRVMRMEHETPHAYPEYHRTRKEALRHYVDSATPIERERREEEVRMLEEMDVGIYVETNCLI